MQLHKHLALFNKVISQGEKLGNGKYQLKQVLAWHDHDGYTCYLSFKDLTMTLYFHNKYAYDYEEEVTLTEFERLVERITRQSA
jgi:Protein of unknown function (DUF3081)